VRKQALVIGLGRFGMSLIRALSERGVEVLAIDRNSERVRLASDLVADAVCLDAADESALSRVSPADRDFAVCAIGDAARDSSILCTALLRQLGAPRVVSRASDPLHARILALVGAHEVVDPIADFGRRLADRLVYERLVGEMMLGDELVIVELRPPNAFVGRTLNELALRARFRVNVVAIRRQPEPSVVLPGPDERIRSEDILVVVGPPGAATRFLEQE